MQPEAPRSTTDVRISLKAGRQRHLGGDDILQASPATSRGGEQISQILLETAGILFGPQIYLFNLKFFRNHLTGRLNVEIQYLLTSTS